MAIQHLKFGTGTPGAQRLHSFISMIEQGRDGLVKELATMQTYVDNSVSPADYSEVTKAYDVDDIQTGQTPTTAQNNMAASLMNEIASDLFKITTDATVDHVNAALNQLFNYTR